MATVKVTLSLSPETVELLSDAAARLAIPKSKVVRDAIQEFHTGIDRLTSAERVRMLAALDEFAETPPTRSGDDVERELAEIRDGRHSDARQARFE
jgi:predicted transcriptional regulator